MLLGLLEPASWGNDLVPHTGLLLPVSSLSDGAAGPRETLHTLL